jgi:shikimate kinase
VDHIKRNGWLVFLDCPRSVLFNRLKNSKNRPMLSSPNRLTKRIESLLEERLPFYRQAHIIINTFGLAEEAAASSIIQKLANYEQQIS